MEGHATRRASHWNLLGQTIIGAIVLLVGLGVSSNPALAESGGTSLQCGTYGPSCTLSASTPEQTGSSPDAPPVHPVSATTAGSNQCQAPNNIGQIVPCEDPDFGWLGSDGCYYKADPTFQPPASDTADQPPAGEAGTYYLVTCAGQGQSTNGGIVWLPSGSAVNAPVLPNPAILAQQAVSQLTLPSPQIDASPSTGADQLVGLPTWLWLGQAAWQATSATAAVPGESVTATATPTSVSWNLGDGTTLVCRGPGTPYTASDSPAEPSPTCGHTFTASSAGRPDSAFAVTATVSWSVAWTGGGQNGTVPDLQTTDTAAFRVADVQSLNTAFDLGL